MPGQHGSSVDDHHGVQECESVLAVSAGSERRVGGVMAQFHPTDEVGGGTPVPLRCGVSRLALSGVVFLCFWCDCDFNSFGSKKGSTITGMSRGSWPTLVKSTLVCFFSNLALLTRECVVVVLPFV